MESLEQYDKCVSQWMKTSKYSYRLEKKEVDSENVFLFTVESMPQVSFSITVSGSGVDKLAVWSDSSEMIPYLSNILEFCESSRVSSIADILNHVEGKIIKIGQNHNEEEEEEEEVEEDFDDSYYDEPEDIAQEESKADEASGGEEEETFFGKNVSPAAFQRLSKDLRNMKKEATKFGIVGTPRGDNIFIWDVKLTDFPSDTKLGKDLRDFAEKFKKEPVVYLEMHFPGEYPMAPPFVRVIRPRFKFLTGHVTIGGSICMEMLTRSGWRPTNDIESILVQIRSEIMSDPNARLDSNPNREYTMEEAKDAFQRMVSRYGWNN